VEKRENESIRVTSSILVIVENMTSHDGMIRAPIKR